MTQENFFTPKISLVGRSGVGKSTLFNRLTTKKNALVDICSKTTRDRQYEFFLIGKEKFMLIDTGGISFTKEKIDTYIFNQTKIAIQESNLILFIVDIKFGITKTDFMIADYLRSCKKIVLLIGNKIDDKQSYKNLSDFYELGLGNIDTMTALHGHGIKNILKKISLLSKNISSIHLEKNKHIRNNFYDIKKIIPIKIAIIGCPNSGKSTLVNTILGKNRVIVYDFPGTTRDSIYIPIERNKKKYIIIDTAGIRKRKKIDNMIEKKSAQKTIQSIKDANVVILVIDINKGLSDQDLCLINLIFKNGKSLVLAFNKAESLSKNIKNNMKKKISLRLNFLSFVKMHFISSLYNIGINCLFHSIHEAYTCSKKFVNTATLMRIMMQAIRLHQTPKIHNRRIKIKYAHMGGYNPFTIVLHGNKLKYLPKSYKCYLINFFRKSLNIIGNNINIEYKENKNPYIQ